MEMDNQPKPLEKGTRRTNPRHQKGGLDLDGHFESANAEEQGPNPLPAPTQAPPSLKFEHTKPSRHEKRHARRRIGFWVLCLAYATIVIALAFFFKEDLAYLALILLFNGFVVFRLGTAAIRALVFPFSLWLISDGFTGSNSLRYSLDFATLLEKSYVILRLQTGKPQE